MNPLSISLAMFTIYLLLAGKNVLVPLKSVGSVDGKFNDTFWSFLTSGEDMP